MRIYSFLAFILFLLTIIGPSSLHAEETAAAAFTTNGNGIIIDNVNDLMWAAEDNKEDINWFAAVEYCANFAKDGYTDWRLPTVAELASITDSKANKLGLYVNQLFTLSDFFLWSKEEHTCKAACYNYLTREPNKFPKARVGIARVIPVRDLKKNQQ